MSILDRYDRTIFTGSPFTADVLRQHCPHDWPRRDIEGAILRACCLNPVAARLTIGLGFSADYLKSPGLRALWAECVSKPVAQWNAHTRSLMAKGANAMRLNLHNGAGIDDDPDEQFRQEILLALSGAVYLMLRRAARKQRLRKLTSPKIVDIQLFREE
ncbi:hypothetical protein ACVWXP_006432 [Bradyrhizobium sp. USDA 4463]